MKSTNNSRSVIVGIFILIGLAIFIITILTLGSQKKTFDKSITVKSFFENVNGLQKGNNIWFSGVKVGTIKKVALTSKGEVEVDMDIDSHSREFIRKDAKAKIGTDGLIGNKIIEIYGGTLSAPPIEEGDLLGNTELLSTDAMMNTLSKNNDNLLQITTDFKEISNRLVEGKGSIGKLLSDETLANQINATTLSLKRTSMNLERLTSDVSTYTSKLNDKGTLASDLVSDTVIFSRLRSAVSQLQQVASTSKEIVDSFKIAGSSLNNSLSTINNGLNNEDAPLGMLLKDEKSAGNIKVILQNLESSSKKLDEDLEAIQHNFLLRGFFKKKEKGEIKDQRVVIDTTL